MGHRQAEAAPKTDEDEDDDDDAQATLATFCERDMEMNSEGFVEHLRPEVAPTPSYARARRCHIEAPVRVNDSRRAVPGDSGLPNPERSMCRSAALRARWVFEP